MKGRAHSAPFATLSFLELNRYPSAACLTMGFFQWPIDPAQDVTVII